MSEGNSGESLYLVVQEEPDEPFEDERFVRAIVYATSPEEATEKVAGYIEYCNEAEEADPDADLDYGVIGYDRGCFQVLSLAENAVRPDPEFMDDSDSILVFETDWEHEEDEEDEDDE